MPLSHSWCSDHHLMSPVIIIIRQPLCPVVGRRPQHAVSKLPCLVLSAAISCRSCICLGRLSTAWLVSLIVFSCHMVSKWWHARSIGRLWGGWYALLRTISFFLLCWLYLWLLSSPWPRCWSFYLCMWCWAYFFPFWSDVSGISRMHAFWMHPLFLHACQNSHSTVTHVTFSLKIMFESCINSIITTVDLWHFDIL